MLPVSFNSCMHALHTYAPALGGDAAIVADEVLLGHFPVLAHRRVVQVCGGRGEVGERRVKEWSVIRPGGGRACVQPVQQYGTTWKGAGQRTAHAPVLSMMVEKERMKAVSAEGKTAGFCRQKRSANFSMMRSIFCASPGRRKPVRKCRMAASKARFPKSIMSTYSCST